LPLTIYVPGEESPCSLSSAILTQETHPALYLYRQIFRFPGETEISVREGVMGLLNRMEAPVFAHEETFPERVAACARSLHSGNSDPGSLLLWCSDLEGTLAPLLHMQEPPATEATDSSGCVHQIWPVRDPAHIRGLQSALEGRSLFLADGHHRFASGWNLATIQIRSRALRSLASHRLVLDTCSLSFPKMPFVEDIGRYLADAPAGYSRSVIVTRGPVFQGFETPHGVHAQRLLGPATIQPVREVSQALAAVEAGRAHLALIMPPYIVAQLEDNARRGILLPPQSTDFYPKLAAGLVIHRNQNENVTPAIAQRLGVLNPSS